MIKLETPTRALLLGYDSKEAELEKALSYKDKRAEFAVLKAQQYLKSFRKRKFEYSARHGEEGYEFKLAQLEARVEVLKSEVKKTVLTRSERGLEVPTGLAQRIAKASDDQVVREYELPEPMPCKWYNEPEYAMRPYQQQAHDLLLRYAGEGPVGVELATGSGKSLVICNLIKSIGRGALVMAPAKSIAGQLVKDLSRYFGSKAVGLYGDGKKQFDRKIVVGIDDSLTRVEPGTEAWEALSSKSVFIPDESHLTPAESLNKVCFGLAANAPYRFFFSATQMRNDGLDIVLDGITGRIVMRKTVKELVDEGWLARPRFNMVQIQSRVSYSSQDPTSMTRRHLYYNPLINKLAGDFANQLVEQKRPVLILVEEVEQFSKLLPHFKHAAAFAHGPLSKENKASVPEAYQESKPDFWVEEFNAGRLPILVGTSCISTGTDIRIAEGAIYLMGGRSEIKITQGVGRETRGGFKGNVLNPWTMAQKKDCVHIDFDITNIAVLHRHAQDRVKVYDKIYPTCDLINMNHLLP